MNDFVFIIILKYYNIKLNSISRLGSRIDYSISRSKSRVIIF